MLNSLVSLGKRANSVFLFLRKKILHIDVTFSPRPASNRVR